MTITADAAELSKLLEKEFEDVPDWALKIKQRGVEAVVLSLWSRWQPKFEWLTSLLTEYPSCWVKNEWSEEGGQAGVWIGSTRSGIQQLEWSEMCLEEKAHRFRSTP